jgi:hypothetical protein
MRQFCFEDKAKTAAVAVRNRNFCQPNLFGKK